MIILQGRSVFGGIAIGKLSFFQHSADKIKATTDHPPEKELERYEKARQQAKNDLQELYTKALNTLDADSANIFEIHAMMLDDEDLNGKIKDLISNKGTSAELAVSDTGRHFSEYFEAMSDPYMRARSADIRDICNRLVSLLSGNPQKSAEALRQRIIFADDLTPSEALGLEDKEPLAIITAYGSAGSHTAILAKSMGIPAIVSVGSTIFEAEENADVIIDGSSGEVYIYPDGETLRRMTDKQKEEKERREHLDDCKGLEAVTPSGQKIKLYANIQSLRELPSVISNDAEGIGLFRSEFLYLDRKDFPSEEEQLEVYKRVLEEMGDKKVIFRTLDIGADKQADYFELTKEENPALGFRAIRICLARPEIFKTQLRALYRATPFGNAAIMCPMISSVEELRQVRRIISEVKEELLCSGMKYSPDTEFGIMIETPAAAIISDKLAEYADFFSIGTNDLTQYTLAMDRQNRQLDEFFSQRHEAVMRLIKFTVESAHRYGKWVGICGEIGADTTLTETFLRMGIDELSVSPSFILPLRDKIRRTDLNKGMKGQYTNE